MTEDFYDLLDVPSDAPQDDIQQAFREQVRIYHPDLNDDERARAQFTALKKAYDILDDPVERRAYDRLGHEDYVAKRTKGLPSPDLWQTRSETESSDPGDSAEGDESSFGAGSEGDTSRRTATASANATGASSGATGATGASSSATNSTNSGGATRSAGSAATGSTGASVGSARRPGTSGSASGERGAKTAEDGSRARAGRRHRSPGTHSSHGQFTENALVRWWHRRRFAWPLIWLSILTYVGGLGDFYLGNQAALRSLGEEVIAIGTDPVAVWELLSGDRHGIDSPTGFVTDVELVSPVLEPVQWYATLAGLVGLSVLFVLGVRLVWRRDTWGPVSIDETIVVALALGVTTTLLGGPLLAGAALMPLLFGVIVYRTRQLPGWSPSYLYVLAVFAPAAALLAGVAGVTSLVGDLFLFVVVPLVGALGLPLRASVRKRFGR